MWGKLRSQRKKINSQLASLSFEDYKPSLPAPSLFAFTEAIVTASIPSSLTIASQLAGLGQGLTPSGDDFMMGALYAVWIIYPHKFSAVLADEIEKTAAPLTTSLSAAWLRSAGKGEAGELWHHLFDALVTGDELRMQESVDNILAVGETSGADAFAGFIGTLQS